MNSKIMSRAACWAEPPPVETGLSVDDRPNKLNIAFWVISSVGATSPLLLHIIYVSVHATSLFFPLYLSFFHFMPPWYKHITISSSLCCILVFSHTLSFHPSTYFFIPHLFSLPFCTLYFSSSAALCFYFVWHSLSLFFLSSYHSLWASLSLPSLSFSLSLALPLISEPWSTLCSNLRSSIALC